MPELSSQIFLDGARVDFTAASLKERGGNTAAQLDFMLPTFSPNYRKYWNKEVLAFFNSSDTYPTFRGHIINTTTNADNSVKFTAVDALGYLTGHTKAEVVLDDSINIDGLTVGASIIKLIKMANLQNTIGTDYLGDTTPIATNTRPRGTVVVLNVITELLNRAIDMSNADLPRDNIIRVMDDGKTSQLRVEVKNDIENTAPVKFYNYEDNIISFNVKSRDIPTQITVTGKGGAAATFKHSSAEAALGNSTKSISNPILESRTECMDFAQKVFLANIRNKYEYTLDTFEGLYLKENDVIHIRDSVTGIEGNFRIIGKNVTFGPNQFKLQLTINNRPPLLSQFLT
tara:strand:- start:1171 stop:2202 length:1032 start_codon:yes stop_codon:yes gene_type:complete